MSDLSAERPELTPKPAPAGPSARRRRLVVALPLVLFAALAGLFLSRLLVGGDPSEIPSALIGRPAPNFDLPPLDGLLRDGAPVPGLSRADLAGPATGGRVTLVNVWASWCGPCRAEHPLLMALARDPDIRLVGINYKDQPENARRFLGGLGNPFAAVGADTRGRAAIDWGVYAVPETFVIAPDGTIVLKHIGPLTEAALNEVLRPAIAAAQAKR